VKNNVITFGTETNRPPTDYLSFLFLRPLIWNDVIIINHDYTRNSTATDTTNCDCTTISRKRYWHTWTSFNCEVTCQQLEAVKIRFIKTDVRSVVAYTNRANRKFHTICRVKRLSKMVHNQEFIQPLTHLRHIPTPLHILHKLLSSLYRPIVTILPSADIESAFPSS